VIFGLFHVFNSTYQIMLTLSQVILCYNKLRKQYSALLSAQNIY